MNARLLSASAVFALFVSAAASAAEQPVSGADAAERAKIEKLRRLAAQGAAETANAGRTTVVTGEILPFADRTVLLGFVDDLRTALEGQLGARGAGAEDAAAVSFRGPGFRVLVRASEDLGGPGIPASVRTSLHPRRDASSVLPAAVVDVFNPADGLDSREFAENVVDAFLRLKILYSAVPGGAPPKPLPRWFSAGLSRLLDASVRQKDFDETRDLWFRAGLPVLPQMLAEDAPFPSAEPALAAQLAAFWLSFPEPAARFRELCRLLGSGVPWSAGLFLSTSAGPSDPLAGDRAFDAWMWGRVRHVLTPGDTTPELVSRTLVAMQLVPGRDGVPADFADRPQPLERLLEPENAAWAPAAATALRVKALRLAAGRGDAYRAAVEEFAAILADLAAGGRRARRAAGRLPAARDALTRSAEPANRP